MVILLKSGRPILVILALCLALGAGAEPAAAQDEQKLATCEYLLSEQWKALWDDNQSGADKVFAKVRQSGCLEPPIVTQLCPIPFRQEIQADLKGRTLLANRARHQQTFLGCDRTLGLDEHMGGR